MVFWPHVNMSMSRNHVEVKTKHIEVKNDEDHPFSPL